MDNVPGRLFLRDERAILDYMQDDETSLEPLTTAQRDYLERVRRAVALTDDLIQKKPNLDYGTLLHTFLCLDLTPSERLAECLRRYGHCSS